MGSAAYIGRVGGLALALGVGTAIATGHGIAAAEGSDSSGSSSQSSSSSGSGSASGSSGSSGSSGTSAGSDAGTSTAGSAAGDADSKDAESSEDTDADADDADDSSDSEDAEDSEGSTDSEDGTATDPDPETDTGIDAEPVAEQPAQQLPKKPRSVRQADTKSPDQKTAATESPVTTPASSLTAPPANAGPEAADPADSLAQADNVAVFASARTLAAATVNPARPATQAAHPLTGVVKVVANVLDWAAGVVPGSPNSPTLAWALLAFARREVDNLLTRLDPAHEAASDIDDTSARAMVAAALNPRPNFPPRGYQFSGSTSFVDWVTGNFAPNDTFNRYGIWGTDVGTMWDNGIPDDPSTPINENQVLIAFGDTFGGPNMTGTWRLNTLFRSPDRNLADGMAVPDGQWFNGNMFGGSPLWEEHYARQIILPERLPRGLPTGVTLIPTAGISVPTPGTQFGATQYVSFMSVKQWGAAGQWSTNYSAIAYSEDNGENWYISPKSVRNNFGGNANFQQAALVRPGDGFVYSYGTPNGRQGQAYISRVAEADILDVTKYEYYSKGSKGGIFGIGAYKAGWYRNDPGKASPVFGRETGACGVGKAGNQVSEMSVPYNKQLGKYVALHGDQFNNVILRTSDRPEGGWSAPTVLMGQQGGGIYAPMMHPWSPSTLGTGTELYFNLSVWNDYNVWLVKTDLAKL